MSRANSGGPAFPCVGLNPHSEQGRAVDWEAEGMTMRDYFAAHAPEAPKWFRHDPDETIPADVENRQVWIREQQAKKFFEWRGFYADCMIAERAK